MAPTTMWRMPSTMYPTRASVRKTVESSAARAAVSPVLMPESVATASE